MAVAQSSWWHCDTLCTSGFMDDVTFSRSGPYGDAWKAEPLTYYHWCCDTRAESDVYECLVLSVGNNYLMMWILQHLRSIGVVGKFVEFFGSGVSQLSIADRATIANMCPEYGATVGYFPIDKLSLDYLRQTGKLMLWLFCSVTNSINNNIFMLLLLWQRHSRSSPALSNNVMLHKIPAHSVLDGKV